MQDREPTPPNRPRARRVRRALLAAGLATGTMVAIATPAFAHVGAATTKADADGTTTIVFSFDEACEDETSSVVSLKVSLPKGTTAVKAEDNTEQGWTAKVTDTDITWSGKPIPNKTDASFTATMKLSGKKGDAVYFPSIKKCDKGEFDAIDIPKTPGEDVGDTAAPTVQIGLVEDTSGGKETTTTEKSGSATTTTAGVATTAKPATPATTDASSSSNTPLIIGIVAAVIIIGGGAGYALSRKKD